MIYLITQRDPFFIDQFLYTFDKFDIPFIVFDMPNFKQGKWTGVKRSFQLYGGTGFVKLIFKMPRNNPFRSLRNAVEIRKVEKMNELNDVFRNAKADDVVLSLSAPSRIPVEIINPKTLKLNFHCGPLPEYAGMMPIFWQMYDGKHEITITLHHMAEEIDEGSLISETRLPVNGTFFELSQRAKEVSAYIFAEVIKNRKEIKATEMSQNKIHKLRKFPKSIEIAKVMRTIRMI